MRNSIAAAVVAVVVVVVVAVVAAAVVVAVVLQTLHCTSFQLGIRCTFCSTN